MVKHVAFSSVVVLIIASCTAPTREELNERWGTIPVTPTVAEFDPSAAIPILPFPIDFAAFMGTEDGTSNIPVTDTTDWTGETGIINAFNTLDGFSTLVPMSATFSGTVDSATVIAGDTVRVFEVTKSQPYLSISEIVRELTPTDFSVHMTHRIVSIQDSEPNGTLKVDAQGEPLMTEVVRDGVQIIPMAPLSPDAAYMVVVGTDILDTEGKNIESAPIYKICKGTEALIDRYGRSTLPIVLSDSEAALLEPLRALTNTYEILLGLQAGLGSSSVALAWSFTTQSVSPVLEALAEATTPADVLVSPVLDAQSDQVTTAAVDPSLGAADIWVGTIDVPYYLSKENPNAPTNFWQGALGSWLTKHYYTLTGLGPVAQSNETIPFILTLPNGSQAPAAGWPVVIFQHDLTQSRISALAVADAMAAEGHAVIAIDLPHHGIDEYNDYDFLSGGPIVSSGKTNFFHLSADAPADFLRCGSCESPGAQADLADDGCPEACDQPQCLVPSKGVYANDATFESVMNSLGERTLDIDGDNQVEGSGLPLGTNFINIAGGLNMRDNLRQAAADLMVLRASIAGIPGLDADKVAFMGHGLGASAGIVFLSEAEKLGLSTSPAVLVSPVSGIARSMEASAQFSLLMDTALVSQGISKGTFQWDAFFMAWQTFLDPADPVNFTGTIDVPALMMEMAGNGVSGNDGNAVWPTNYTDGPWAAVGSSSLAENMGLLPISSTIVSDEGVNAIVRFVTSDHRTMLDPGIDACNAKRCDLEEYQICQAPIAATTEAMQNQAAEFIATSGTKVHVSTMVLDALGVETRLVCEPHGFACAENADCCGKSNCIESVCQ